MTSVEVSAFKGRKSDSVLSSDRVKNLVSMGNSILLGVQAPSKGGC